MYHSAHMYKNRSCPFQIDREEIYGPILMGATHTILQKGPKKHTTQLLKSGDG